MGKGKRGQKQKGNGVVKTTQSESTDNTLSKDQVGAESDLVSVHIGHVPQGATAINDQYKKTGKGKRKHAGNASDATKSKKSRKKQMAEVLQGGVATVAMEVNSASNKKEVAFGEKDKVSTSVEKKQDSCREEGQETAGASNAEGKEDDRAARTASSANVRCS